MTDRQPQSLNTIRDRPDCGRAVVFLHGFSGDRDDTWDRMTGLVGTTAADWDIYTLGYSTTVLPSFLGRWFGSPDLSVVAIGLTTQARIDPLRRYKSLALVAHSMGGLAVQRALIDDCGLVDRTEKVILFGTPSAGLGKASRLKFWNRQLRDMADDGEFITTLRQDWSDRLGREPGFDLRVVAGEEDVIVPPASSLAPFPRHLCHVISGNHISMIKAIDTDSPSVRLLCSVLSDVSVESDASSQLSLAAELPDDNICALIEAYGDDMSEQDIVHAALALERNGKRDEAMAILYRYQPLGTDAMGTLAGRIKRIWIENEDPGFAHHALTLYHQALNEARNNGDESQVFYLAINVAFLEFVACDRVDRAGKMARLALKSASRVESDVWSVATQAEANLLLGNQELALKQYRSMLVFGAEPWKYASTALQAGQIASKLEDVDLADEIEEIFTPVALQANNVIVSSSTGDAE